MTDLDKEVAELGIDELLKGMGKLSVAYLALRIRELEQRHDEELKSLRQRIDALEHSLAAARDSYREISGRMRAFQDNGH